MPNEDKSLWLTCNGEIYNFRELRASLAARGHRFRSETDVEAILHLYEEEGPGSVRALRGMFAFGLWDERESLLWLCRDRLGIKPLVYFWNGRYLAFASEIKALLCDPAIPRSLDLESLLFYLAFNYVPAPRTIFKGINKLKPGHFLTLKDGELRIVQYWRLPDQIGEKYFSKDPPNKDTRCKEYIIASLEDAVKARMIADVPLGAFLSGGIDSSIVVSLMARNSSRPIKTFSIGYTDAAMFDETSYARQVASRFRTDHHELRVVPEDIREAFEEVLEALDEPLGDCSTIPTYVISKKTRAHVTVALSGDGGDELFGGYPTYLAEYWYMRYSIIPQMLRKRLILPLVERLPDSRDTRLLNRLRQLKLFVMGGFEPKAQRLLRWREIFPEEVRIALSKPLGIVGGNDPSLKWMEEKLESAPVDPINAVLYTDLIDLLPNDMLAKVDWMSMANGLEVRVPFLDHRVVESAFTIPGSLKIRRGIGKYLLRDAFKELLPAALYRRSKQGFEIPIGRWLKTDLRFLLDRYLDKGKIMDQGLFDPEVIRRLIKDLEEGRRDTSWMLWNLIVFQHWYERHF